VVLAPLFLVLVAAGCGSKSASPPPTANTTTTTTIAAAPTTTAPPLGKPVPAGFQPLSFTAISANDFWLLGRTAIARTTDGGTTFDAIPAPPLPPPGETTPVLRFADADDGFAYLPQVANTFYATHDGGATWHRVTLGPVIAFATGGGYVSVVAAQCTTTGDCTKERFERARVSSDEWSSSALPFTPSAPEADLAAHGSTLWLLAPKGNSHDELAKSTDGGATFSTTTGPCYSDLGGDVEPSSASVLWAICPTGMLSGAWRSTDTGESFASLKTPELVNSALIAPASDTTAVIAQGTEEKLLRTTDAGATWSPVARSPEDVSFIGFTDASTGAALARNGTLWRTTDGGASWAVVPIH
jgi:hypothetical protein